VSQMPASPDPEEPGAVRSAREALAASRELPLEARPDALDAVHRGLADALRTLDDED
jgi:hypothetical protein